MRSFSITTSKSMFPSAAPDAATLRLHPEPGRDRGLGGRRHRDLQRFSAESRNGPRCPGAVGPLSHWSATQGRVLFTGPDPSAVLAHIRKRGTLSLPAGYLSAHYHLDGLHGISRMFTGGYLTKLEALSSEVGPKAKDRNRRVHTEINTNLLYQVLRAARQHRDALF
jgi:hypothetical protein